MKFYLRELFPISKIKSDIMYRSVEIFLHRSVTTYTLQSIEHDDKSISLYTIGSGKEDDL